MTIPISWRKSSHSTNGGDCVEVRSDLTAMRDTKNPGPQLAVDIRALVRAVRRGQLD